ncbi:MAG TPA: histidine kinase [Cyclobacteriaceae bacterium]|nr:histidine kinase [Cyclobacteriaceae bacterium]
MSPIYQLIYSEKKAIRILRHALFWAADFLSYLVFVNDNPITTTIVLGLFSRLPLIVTVVCFILYYLIPRYSKDQSKSGLYIWILVILVVIGFGFRLYGYYLVDPWLHKDQTTPLNLFSANRIVRELLSWMGVIMMAIAIKLMKQQNKLLQQNDELLHEKRAAELSFLKAQMHPHFLFNTLNTLYSDALKTDSKSEQIVLRLSSLMRFMLEECSKPLVTLAQEIRVIDDYIELEKIRHGDRLRIHWNPPADDATVYLSPLLLLPFVENSFKHTLTNQRGVINIRIAITIDQDWIFLEVENPNLRSLSGSPSAPGLGISNVRKQLKLLYDNHFSLDIQEGDTYLVRLKIPRTHTP